MLRRVALWLVIILLTVSVSAAWAATPGEVDVNALNLRSGPGLGYKVISTLKQGTPLVVLAQSGDWQQVMTASGLTGWVFGQYIVTDRAFQEGNQNLIVRATKLNVRQGPGTSYPVIASLAEGQLVQATGKINEWFQIKLNGKIGFVHQEWVTPVTSANSVQGPLSVPVARVAVSVLNMRAGKGTQFPVIAKLTNGTLVAILEEGTWSRIMLENGVEGFVLTEYIQHVDGGQALARISASAVNVRSGPGTSFDVVATHPLGQTFTFNGWENGWAKVSSSVSSGYILGSLVSFAFTTGDFEATTPEVTSDSLKGFIIAIDAGHGGSDPGAIGVNGLREKDVNLTMALKLRDMLLAAGAQVVMTRNADYRLTLDERINIAHNAGADLFVSIHNNAHPSSDVSGTQVFYGVTPGSFNLGNLVHRRLVGLGLNDKGLLSANFAVLVRTRIPAILTETAFLSNPNDAALLAQEEFINQAVRAHFEGIHEWLVTTRR